MSSWHTDGTDWMPGASTTALALVVLGSVLSFGHIAVAQTGEVGAGTETATIGEPVPQTFANAAPQKTPAQQIAEQVQTILSGSSRRKSLRRLSAGELKALQAFYSTDDRYPIWVDDTGPTRRAKAVIAVLSEADQHGLRASDYRTSQELGKGLNENALANLEIDLSARALLYARHAKGGRASSRALGLQLTYEPQVLPASQVLQDLAVADDVSAYLNALHPRHPQYRKLRQRLAELRGAGGQTGSLRIPDGPVLRNGVRHPHVALLRKRLSAMSISIGEATGDAEQFDAALERAVKDMQTRKGLVADGIVGAGTRRALNGRTPDKLIKKIVANMERWRWLPDELDGGAKIYIWANIPGLRVRVVRDGEVVFSERSIVGQISHKTPVFSDKLEWIELHPTWYVPASIKVSDILPSLRRRTSTVMERYNLRVNCGKYGTNYKAIDWRTIDISKCSFSQPPGKTSVLGDFKFKFPNRHSVYMHDTHDRSLFSRRQRTFSHGCIRVKNPRRMAELILSHDKGMSSARIGQILAGPKVLHKETLNRPVPVHITYFTVLFDDDGKLTTRPDYYGYDGRLTAVLNGRAVAAVKRKPRRRKKPPTAPSGWWNGFLTSN